MLPNGVGQAFDNSKFELVRLVWTSYRWHSCWTADIGTIVNLHVDINNVLATTSFFSNQFLEIDCKARMISGRKNGVTVSVGETRSFLQGLVARTCCKAKKWNESVSKTYSKLGKFMSGIQKFCSQINVFFFQMKSSHSNLILLKKVFL